MKQVFVCLMDESPQNVAHMQNTGTVYCLVEVCLYKNQRVLASNFGMFWFCVIFSGCYIDLTLTMICLCKV